MRLIPVSGAPPSGARPSAAGRLTPVAAALIAAALLAPAAEAQTAPVKVYSSMPLQGAARPQTQAVVNGARLALAEAGGVAGGSAVRLVSLSNARGGAWTPARTARNARRAANDRRTVAYIGEFNSGASAISIPILNEAGVPQVSPSNTAIGLTRNGPGAHRGEPDKYYPLGTRTFFRLQPNDRVQGGALAAAMRSRGCTRAALLHDGESYGRGVNRALRTGARRLGLRVVADRSMRGSRRAAVRRARRAGANCVAYTGITANGAVPLVRSLGRALPRARFFGSDGVAESGFTSRLPRRVAARTFVTVSTLAPSAYPPAGQAFFGRYRARFGPPDPYAIYGYEAMRVILDAINAGGASRRGVRRALHAMGSRASVLGTYTFDRFGDTTLKTYGLYGIRGASLVWAGAVTAP